MLTPSFHRTVRTRIDHRRATCSRNRRQQIFAQRGREQAFLDGILCFFTNDVALTTEQIIGHYRRKNKIEDTFRELKSYLHLPPFHLTREKRVKAHVTIYVLSYLLLNALEEKLSWVDDLPSGKTTLKLFDECKLNRSTDMDSDTYVESTTELTEDQIELLKQLDLAHLTGKNISIK